MGQPEEARDSNPDCGLGSSSLNGSEEDGRRGRKGNRTHLDWWLNRKVITTNKEDKGACTSGNKTFSFKKTYLTLSLSPSGSPIVFTFPPPPTLPVLTFIVCSGMVQCLTVCSTEVAIGCRNTDSLGGFLNFHSRVSSCGMRFRGPRRR